MTQGLIGLLSLILTTPLFAEWHGFLDTRAGGGNKRTLSELRVQLENSGYAGPMEWQFKRNVLYDDVAGIKTPDLENGSGWFDLREAYSLWAVTDWSDIKIGRQTLTWGVGDLLFINDLFPKDWISFFSGRDETYLKAPSDALLISCFPSFADIEIVYTPRFDADRYITGKRISFYNSPIVATQPDSWFKDDEFSIRISRNIGYEMALYVYNGYWKSPAGRDSQSGNVIFPALSVYGASARGNLWEGILSLEGGFYDSRDDRKGNDPLIRNSEFRSLFGYEREIMRETTLGIQYYLEWMQDYSAYKASQADGVNLRDELRQVVSIRLTKMLWQQNLKLSFFAFSSPSDKDGYLRPSVSYKINDAWEIGGGANIFFGEENHTFFSQFDDNNNLYGMVRYNF